MEGKRYECLPCSTVAGVCFQTGLVYERSSYRFCLLMTSQGLEVVFHVHKYCLDWLCIAIKYHANCVLGWIFVLNVNTLPKDNLPKDINPKTNNSNLQFHQGQVNQMLLENEWTGD